MVTQQDAVNAVARLEQAVMDLDALIAKEADAGTLAFAHLWADFYGKELGDLSERLRSAARASAVEAVA